MVKKAKERVERLHRMKRAKEKGSYRSSTLMALIPKRLGLTPIAPSKAKRKKSKKISRRESAPHYNTYKKRNFNKPSTSKNFPKKFKKGKKKKESKFEKYLTNGRCFNCGETGHYADKCPKPPKKIKQEIECIKYF
jgi:hypothetical protein